MKLPKRLINTFLAIAASCFVLSAAAAPTESVYSFNATTVGAFGSGPYGSVTLTQNSGDVNVEVNLRSDLNFVDTGSHSILSFNVAGATTADIQGITFANGLGDVFATQTGAASAPFSTFILEINCTNVPGNKCTKGASGGGYLDPLTFTVKNANLADFAHLSTGNGIAAYFAADVNLGNTTGVIGATLAPVPEPESYAMLLAGLGLIGTITIRRRNHNNG